MLGKPKREDLKQRIADLEKELAEQEHEKASVRRSAEETGRLVNLCRRIFSSPAPDPVISNALEELHLWGISDMTMLYLLDGGDLVLGGVRPKDHEWEKPGPPAGSSVERLCGMAADSGQGVYASDMLTDPRCAPNAHEGAEFRSFAGLPMIEGDRVLGVLGFASRTPRDYRGQAPFLEAVAGQVGTALRNALLHEQARRHAADLEAGLGEARRIEEALRESEAKYRLLVEQAPAGIYEVDFVENRFTNVNDVMCAYAGYTKEEFLSMSPLDILTEESRALFTERLRKAASGEIVPGAVECRVRGKGGRAFWVILNSRLAYENGRAVGATVVAYDITHLKRVEEAFRESEEKYRFLVEYATDGIFIAQNGIIKFPNPKTLEILGYSAGELAAKPYLDLIHPEDRHIILDRKEKRRRGDDIPNTYALRIINSQGEELWAQVNAVDIRWEGGPATLNFVRDVTPQKRLEAQFSQAQKMEAVGTLAGGIAHDFNNLLMGIQGNASLMLLDMDEEHPHYERLKNIERQVMSGAELTRQLLGFARGGKYEVKATNLNDLIEKTASMFGRAKKEIEIHNAFEPRLWTVEVDQGQIEQVLLNLFVNAWQAMPNGGDLFLETENAILDENHERPFHVVPGRYVRMSVTDTGTGMDKATQARIFEPFFTTKARGMGTGLGLASVYGIIKNHGGIIEVLSEAGKGARFTIYLPASAKAVARERVGGEEILEGRETVLLVDDEETVVDVARRMLEKLGYRVLTARNGREAVEVYENDGDRISMVILDMIMPGLGGGETYERLKRVNEHIRVLLSSGYSLDSQAAEILRRGCDGFIQKPFNMEQLSQKVREILSKSQGGSG